MPGVVSKNVGLYQDQRPFEEKHPVPLRNTRKRPHVQDGRMRCYVIRLSVYVIEYCLYKNAVVWYCVVFLCEWWCVVRWWCMMGGRVVYLYGTVHQSTTLLL